MIAKEKFLNIFRGLLQIILGVLILVAVLLSSFAAFLFGVGLAFLISMEATTTIFSNMIVFWIWIFICCLSPFLYLMRWVIKDIKKNISKGGETNTRFWILGMIPPIVFVVFPIYLLKRNIVWPKENKTNFLPAPSSDHFLKLNKEKSKIALITVGVLVILIIIIGVVSHTIN